MTWILILFKKSWVTFVEFAVCMQDLMLPGALPANLGMVNPQLAEILQGYKNALDVALMATRMISSTQGSSAPQQMGLPLPYMRPAPRRTDTLEVCCSLHSQLLIFCASAAHPNGRQRHCVLHLSVCTYVRAYRCTSGSIL